MIKVYYSVISDKLLTIERSNLIVIDNGDNTLSLSIEEFDTLKDVVHSEDSDEVALICLGDL